MRREHQRTPNRDHELHQSRLVETARRGARSAGEPIRDTVRRPLESQLGHDFRDVRIHHDAEAGDAAREMAARAYTVGQDVVFGEGSYAPETSDGAGVLIHELTHVVQQSHGRTPGDTESGRVIDARDPSELAADRATQIVMAGDAVAVDSVGTIGDSSASTGGAVVQRWGLGDVWDTVSGAASTVAGGVESAGSAAYGAYEKATDFRGLANGLDKGVDWAEKESAAGTQAMVDSASGIPVLSQLAQGAAWTENAVTDVTGGVVKGAGDLVSGVAGGLAHPIDAAAGMEGMAEHIGTGVPFLGTTLKGIHGIYDLAVHGGGEYGNSFGDLGNHLFNPLQQSADDSKYVGALGKGILAPGDEKDGGGWQRWKDNPLEAASRALTNIAPAVMGVGEATAPEAAADATSAAAKAVDTAAATADTADATTAALKPAGSVGAPSGSQTIQEMIDDTLGNAQGLSDGSRPLTSEGMWRNSPIVEAKDPVPGPGTGGGGSPAPAVAPAASSGPGMFSRIGDWFRSTFGGDTAPAPKYEPGSDNEAADAYNKRFQAKGGPSDEELAPVETVLPDNGGGYGARPLLGGGQNFPAESLYRRRRGW